MLFYDSLEILILKAINCRNFEKISDFVQILLEIDLKPVLNSIFNI